MNRIDLMNRTIGVNPANGNNASICVWAPEAESMELVAGEKRLQLEKDAYGYWQLKTALQPGQLYKFSKDGGEAFPDPASLSQPEGVHGASQYVQLQHFNWTDQEWKNPSLDQYIIYELHVGTFSPEGDFRGVINKLDHLLQLGINAIEIMPVAQFPGSRNWGYDGVFPFAVQHSYGGAEGLQQLVNACHEKGIAVILDVVYNHLGPEGNYLGAFGPYFTEKYKTPWGGALNFDDAWCDGVRNYFIENALMWMRDFHIDALRLDAVHAIRDFSPNHILQEITHYKNCLEKKTGKQYHLVAEVDLNDPKYIRSLEQGGYGMGAQWIDEFHHALRVAAGGERSGYYSDFNGLPALAKSYRDAYVYDGQWSQHRNKFFGQKAEQHPGQQFVVFSQNHDQVGNRMLGERSSQLYSFEMTKLMAGAVMVSPFIPMLFMGEEWAEENPFLYFVSHTDKELAEAVRKGRKEEFAAFHAQGEAPDPNDPATFEKSKLQWKLLDKDRHQVMFRYYQELIRIRKNVPSLHRLERNHVHVECMPERNLLTIHRWHEEEHCFIIMNFSRREQNLQAPSYCSEWNRILDSAHPQWLGSMAAPAKVKASKTINVQPETILVYVDQKND